MYFLQDDSTGRIILLLANLGMIEAFSLAHSRNDPSLAASELALRIEEAALATGKCRVSNLVSIACSIPHAS